MAEETGEPMDIDNDIIYHVGEIPTYKSKEDELFASAEQRIKEFEVEYEKKRRESREKMKEELTRVLGPCQAHLIHDSQERKMKFELPFYIDLMKAARICDRTLKHAAYYADGNNKDAKNWQTLCGTYLDAYLTDKLLENAMNQELRQLFCPDNAYRTILGVHIYRIKMKYNRVPKEDTQAVSDFIAIKALFDTPSGDIELTGVEDLQREKEYIDREMKKLGDKLRSAYDKATNSRAQAPGSTDFTPRLRF